MLSSYSLGKRGSGVQLGWGRLGDSGWLILLASHRINTKLEGRSHCREEEEEGGQPGEWLGGAQASPGHLHHLQFSIPIPISAPFHPSLHHLVRISRQLEMLVEMLFFLPGS